jgi:hypothetical protein
VVAAISTVLAGDYAGGVRYAPAPSAPGYLTECRDGEYSMSGGREGVCTDHGGATRPVYHR